jgi:PEGA domain
MSRRRVGARVLLASAALVAASLTGCVERRYTIRSNVPGTLVYVNNEEIGPVPASKTFYYYGDREIVLAAPGYKTQRLIQKVDAPWFDNLLTEFFTENLLPFTLRDEREFNYAMEPAVPEPEGDLVARGEALRVHGQQPPKQRRGGILGYFGF